MAGEQQVYLSSLNQAQPIPAFAAGWDLGMDENNFQLNATRVAMEGARLQQQQQQQVVENINQQRAFQFQEAEMALRAQSLAAQQENQAFSQRLDLAREARMSRGDAYKETYDRDSLALRRWESTQRATTSTTPGGGGTIDLETGQFIPAMPSASIPSVGGGLSSSAPPAFSWERDQNTAINSGQPLPANFGSLSPLTTPEGDYAFGTTTPVPRARTGEVSIGPLPGFGEVAANEPNPLFGQYPEPAQPAGPSPAQFAPSTQPPREVDPFGTPDFSNPSTVVRSNAPAGPQTSYKTWMEFDLNSLGDQELATAQNELKGELARQQSIYDAHKEVIQSRNLTLANDTRPQLQARLTQIDDAMTQRQQSAKVYEDRRAKIVDRIRSIQTDLVKAETDNPIKTKIETLELELEAARRDKKKAASVPTLEQQIAELKKAGEPESIRTMREEIQRMQAELDRIPKPEVAVAAPGPVAPAPAPTQPSSPAAQPAPAQFPPGVTPVQRPDGTTTKKVGIDYLRNLSQ